MENLTIVIQGRIEEECIRHMVAKYRENIIISTWDDVDLGGCGNLGGVRVVRSPVPTGDVGPTNMMFQFNSTIAGLSACDTEYAIKMRGDEYFSNLEEVDRMIRADDRIHCIPVFMPRHRVRPFCVGDHFLAGRRSELEKMFQMAKEWWLTRPGLRRPKMPVGHQIPECILGATYLHSKRRGVPRPNLMMKYFSIIPLEALKDYRITWNNSSSHGEKRVYYNDFDPETHGRGSITSIEQITE